MGLVLHLTRKRLRVFLFGELAQRDGAERRGLDRLLREAERDKKQTESNRGCEFPEHEWAFGTEEALHYRMG